MRFITRKGWARTWSGGQPEKFGPTSHAPTRRMYQMFGLFTLSSHRHGRNVEIRKSDLRTHKGQEKEWKHFQKLWKIWWFYEVVVCFMNICTRQNIRGFTFWENVEVFLHLVLELRVMKFNLQQCVGILVGFSIILRQRFSIRWRSMIVLLKYDISIHCIVEVSH